MNARNLTKCNVYKMVVISIFICCLFACQDNAVSSLSIDEHKEQPIKKVSEKEKKEIDWAMVAIADGGGAALGATLAKYSGNIYVMMASAVGVGAYASYCEYERQKDEIEDEEIVYYPDAINPYIPFVPYSLLKEDVYNICEKRYRYIGEFHNTMVLNMDNKYSDIQEKNNEEIFFETYKRSFENLDIDANSVIGQIPKIYPCVMMHMAQGWSCEKDTLLKYHPSYLRMLRTAPIEEVLQYINYQIEEVKENKDEDLVLLSVAYYSKCLWNTMATTPTIAQECFVWSLKDKAMKYVEGRDSVIEIITKHSNYDYLLYPAYDKNRLIALYLYTNPTQYGFSKYIDNLEIESTLYHKSRIQESEIIIPKGSYKVEPTKCKDVYVIKL